MKFVCILIFVLNYKTVWIISDDSFYTAGVVEFRPNLEEINSSVLLEEHLKYYLDIIKSSKAADIDIIVFPEGTLNNEFQLTYVPSETDRIIPCLLKESKLYANFLVQLSCAARNVSKYLVVNLTEKDNCPSDARDLRPCASNKLNIFNTNVVFDREGRIVSRYRKVHIYVENKNTTYDPEFAVFDTDFGVRFGHFICFDMLFYTPAQELVDQFAVTDFIFTSFFYSELPFLTAVQLQHGWSWGNNVNLLAAGASYPEFGVTGTGIYAGEFGDLISFMASKEGERTLYKARVPKKNSQFIPETISDLSKQTQTQTLTKLHLLKDPQIKNYNSILLDIKQSENYYLHKKLCDSNVCCSFEIYATIVNKSQEINFKYRAGIFDGRRTYEKEEWSDIKVCALYTCTNKDPISCGEAVTTENVLFTNISIKGNFPKQNKVLIMPSILNDRFYPLKHYAVMWSKTQLDNHYEVHLKLLQEQTNIMTFGIYGQYFELTSVASAKVESTFIIIFISFSLLCATIFEC